MTAEQKSVIFGNHIKSPLLIYRCYVEQMIAIRERKLTPKMSC